MMDKIVMQLCFSDGAKVELVDPCINVKSDMGGVGNIQGKLEGSIWTGQVHLWLENSPNLTVQYSKDLIEVRLLSDQTDFPEHSLDIPQIPIHGFSYEAYYENLKNIKEHLMSFYVYVEEHKKKAVNE